jgi:hypothetical protein
MDRESWNLVESHTNLVETSHAGRNRETRTGMALLAAIEEYVPLRYSIGSITNILNSARHADNEKAKYFDLVDKVVPLRNQFNGLVDRERKSANRRAAKSRKKQQLRETIEEYQALETESEWLKAERAASLDRKKEVSGRLSEIKERLALGHEADLALEKQHLLDEQHHGISMRKQWADRRAAIAAMQQTLKDGPLKGVRLNGGRPDTASESSKENLVPFRLPSTSDMESGSCSGEETGFEQYSGDRNPLEMDFTVDYPEFDVAPGSDASLSDSITSGPLGLLNLDSGPPEQVIIESSPPTPTPVMPDMLPATISLPKQYGGIVVETALLGREPSTFKELIERGSLLAYLEELVTCMA